MQRKSINFKNCCSFLVSACASFGRVRSFSTNPVPSSKVRISYLTDVEGDLMYLKRYVENSKVIKFSNEVEGGDKIDFVDDMGQLVYGGDICDKGGHDLKVLELLLDLKERYNDRVHFIIGNRDANKLRILQEIGVSQYDKLPYHKGSWWLAGTGRIGDPMSDESSVPDEAGERLKWILKYSMGSPDAFEYRRSELAEVRGVSIDNVSENDVVQSYRDFASPDGLLGRYLSKACLALRLGNVLFIHGALPLTDILCDDNTYKYPTPWNGGHVRTLDSWISHLNDFVIDEFDAWKHSIKNHGNGEQLAIWSTIGGYQSGSSGGGLIQYCMGWIPGVKIEAATNPRKTWTRNPTVVYNNWERSELLNNRDMIGFFKENNLQAIVTGHQPHGDSPLSVRVDEDCFIISADTSYSGDVKWLEEDCKKPQSVSKSFRGDQAVSELLIDVDNNGDLEYIEAHGVLSNGVTYTSSNFLNDPCVGLFARLKNANSLDNEWWTKFRMNDGKYLVCHTEGYEVTNAIVDSADLLSA